MSWTTVCDLHMQAYQGSQTLDATDFKNHADILGNIATQSGYVGFQADDAQLEIPVRDDSLTRFAGLRVQALIRPHNITRRYNIAEGWMSFAFFIESDGRLMATIYDGQQWIGPDSGANKIPANSWSRVSFEYDGVSIARLKLNGSVVGSRVDMPHVIRQPHQVITLGHWPRADGRYTLKGELGHVRIERRDYEDYWRDAVQTAFCRRRLSPEQADAKREIEFLVSTMDTKEQERLRNCAIKQAERMREFMHKLRSLTPRGFMLLASLGARLRLAWCCSLDTPMARKELLEFFRAASGAQGSEAREKFLDLVDEFFEISKLCAFDTYPFTRIKELNLILFPELQDWEMEIRQLVEMV